MCLLRPRACPRDLICPAHTFWGRLQTNLIQQLQSARLDVLVAEAQHLQHRPGQRAIPYVFPEAVRITDA